MNLLIAWRLQSEIHFACHLFWLSQLCRAMSHEKKTGPLPPRCQISRCHHHSMGGRTKFTTVAVAVVVAEAPHSALWAFQVHFCHAWCSSDHVVCSTFHHEYHEKATLHHCRPSPCIETSSSHLPPLEHNTRKSQRKEHRQHQTGQKAQTP